MDASGHLFLVDGSGYVFRAYHALPPLTRRSDGLPIGAVSGFCNMLWKLLGEVRDGDPGVAATHFAVVFDHSARTFRHDIDPAYKANRPPPPEDLVPQFGLVRAATLAFGLPCVEMKGFEADDLIATHARLAARTGARVTVVSSDKDLMQLVSERIEMFDTLKGRRITPAQVRERWGVGPERMVDLQALAGDPTDNVPGVPGIGPKTAAQLLQTFGDLDTLLERSGEIGQTRRRENLIAHADRARLSRRLVRLRDDVPVTGHPGDFRLETQDGPRLIAFLKAMDFTTLTRRVAAATDTDALAVEAAAVPVEWSAHAHGPDLETAPAPALCTPGALVRARACAAAGATVDRDAYQCIRNGAALAAFVEEAREAGVVAFDTETTSLDAMQAALVGFSLAFEPQGPGGAVRAAYVPLAHRTGEGDLLGGGAPAGPVEGQMPLDEALAQLRGLTEDPSVLKVAHNLKYDWQVLRRHGVEVRGFDDTMVMSSTLDAGRGGHGLDALSERWLGHRPIAYKQVTGQGRSAIGFDRVAIDKATAYAAEDADVTLRVWRVLKPRLAAEGLATVYERLERPLIAVLARMEARGIAIDRAVLARLSREFSAGAAALGADIQRLAGEAFNPASPRQLGEILFGKMGFSGGSKTRTGQWSTSARVLEDLAAAGHDLPRRVVEWRQLAKLQSAYTDALPGFVNPDTGRVHTSYALAATSTGRLASSDPNLQNIPVRTPEGRKIRAAFIARPGARLVSADYSQIELRVLAHVAGIGTLRQAFADGIDIHAMTASEMFGIPADAMPPEVRRRAKAINFGIIYGISAFGLANQLGIGRGEAGDYIETYFRRFPGIRDYMEATKARARADGYVETMFGRRAHYPDIASRDPRVRAFNERAVINAPIQGSAADIIRRAMVRMDPALEQAGLQARMLLQVHDELVFEAPDAEVEATIRVVGRVMEDAAMPAVAMTVPLKVDARAAVNWDEAH